MRGHFGRLALAGLATACLSAGCIIPSYQLPAGFSSSYQRQLYGMDPPPPPVDGGLSALTMRPGIFYPETAFNDPPVAFDSNASRGVAPGPLVLGTDPLSPPPKVAKALPDDIY
jgi:hypothetical protein